MRSSTDSVNGNEYLVSGLDVFTFSGYNVYEIFENEDEIITKD